MSVSNKIEPEDFHIVRTDKSLEENTWEFLKKGFMSGAIISGFTMEKAFETTPISVLAARTLFGFAIPGGVAAVIFASTTSMLDKMRGKKHLTSNAVVGGALAGMFLSCRSVKPWLCFKSTLALGAIAGTIRYAVTSETYARRLDEQGNEQAKQKQEVYMSRYEHLRPKA